MGLPQSEPANSSRATSRRRQAIAAARRLAWQYDGTQLSSSSSKRPRMSNSRCSAARRRRMSSRSRQPTVCRIRRTRVGPSRDRIAIIATTGLARNQARMSCFAPPPKGTRPPESTGSCVPAAGGSEEDNLVIRHVAGEFLLRHPVNLVRRIQYNYFLHNFSVASVELRVGTLFVVFGGYVGVTRWLESIETGLPATSGTVMLAASWEPSSFSPSWATTCRTCPGTPSTCSTRRSAHQPSPRHRAGSAHRSSSWAG